jgi:hypothetical protein
VPSIDDAIILINYTTPIAENPVKKIQKGHLIKIEELKIGKVQGKSAQSSASRHVSWLHLHEYIVQDLMLSTAWLTRFPQNS